MPWNLCGVGFAFEMAGRHLVEVIILWDINGLQLGVEKETEVWVAYPLTDKDNQIAALLLDREVGGAVASGHSPKGGKAEMRIREAVQIQTNHPACAQLKKLGLTK